ncbi:MAG: glutamate--tRNA ligase, partial [Fimbriiglobus sp.]
AAMTLMAAGHAYPDYTTAEEQDIRRRAKRDYVHRGSNRDVPPEENLRQFREKPAPVLLKVPAGEKVVFRDHVRGDAAGMVTFDTDTIRDPALLRAAGPDGVCRALYSFATVVDEIDFGITHVIRAEEHLSNTPAQVLIFRALGGAVPEFAHIPLVNYKNEKMSKRKLPPLSPADIAKLTAGGWTPDEIAARDDLNIATVTYYRELGYLPAALVNYLVRLGWSLDGESEFIPLDVLLKEFSLERITKASANFDPEKLYWLQGEYMKLLPTAEKLDKSLPYLRRAKLIGDTPDDRIRATLTAVIDAAADRIKLFSDVLTFAGPFLKADPDYDAKAVEKSLKAPGAAEQLRAFRDVLAGVEVFDVPSLEKALHDFTTARNEKPKALVAAVRVAATGTTVGFGLYESLTLLGKSEVLRRIDMALTL